MASQSECEKCFELMSRFSPTFSSAVVNATVLTLLLKNHGKHSSHRKKSALPPCVTVCDETKAAVRLRLPPDGTRITESLMPISNHSRTSFASLSTQTVSFSRHLCSRRDARVDKPMPKERLGTVTRKIQIYLH